MENRYEVEGNLFESVAYYATKSVEKAGAELMNIRTLKCTKYGDTRIGIVFDHCKRGDDRKLELIMWPAYHLSADEQVIMDMDGIAEVEYRINLMLDPETNKPLVTVDPKTGEKKVAQPSVKWYAWKDLNGEWHKPSGDRVKFIDLDAKETPDADASDENANDNQ